ncbi:MAG: Fe-S cluster assembly protein SufD [Gammaproteobacteria bacterium]|nr:Fe-S cluster assembly protein SufD [Gammaproteobacteria bacterium]
MNAAAGPVERYLAEFARVKTTLAGAANPPLQQARKSALARFAKSGFPTRRDENWKYTDISAIEKRTFKPAEPSHDGIARDRIDAVRFNALECHELVFINGHFSKALSRKPTLPKGVIVDTLASALEHRGGEHLEHLSQYANDGANSFAALNTAFMADGAYINLSANARVDHPIHLLFLSTEQDDALMNHPRNLVILGEQAELTVIESYIGLDGAKNFTNTVTEVALGRGAVIEHYKLQQEGFMSYHIGSLHIRQSRDSRVYSHSISLGGAIARNDIHTVLAEEGAEVILHGLYMASNRQHVDNHTRIDHMSPRTQSVELYKGVLDGHARGVFNGKVVVHEGAVKTDARQSNNNLLLSDTAEVDTKPELEIYADDVKCSHGATVGQLDKDALYYLRTRAIDEDAASSLLTYAFAGDVIHHIKFAPIRARLEQVVIRRLPNMDRIRDIL